MPYRMKRKCNKIGCKKLTYNSYCEEHAKQVYKERDSYRQTAQERGYTSMWVRNSKQFLKENPLCEICYEAHRLTPATVVHHRIDHKGDQELFWDVSNWQALCKQCHDKLKDKKCVV